MKKRNGLFRLLLLLALIICTSMPLSVFAAEETIDDIPVEDMVLPEPPDAGAEANPDPYAIMPLAYNYSTIPESMLDNSILRALEYTGYENGTVTFSLVENKTVSAIVIRNTAAAGAENKKLTITDISAFVR